MELSDLIPAVVGNQIKILVAARGTGAQWAEQLLWVDPTQLALPPLDRPAMQTLVASIAEFGAVSGDDAVMARFHSLTGGDPLLVQLQLQLLSQAGEGTAEQRLEKLLETASPGDPLKDFFDRWWEEQQTQWGEHGAARVGKLQDLLNLLACAKGPLGLEDLSALLDVPSDTVREALEQLGRFVIADQAGDRYVFSHSRLRDYFVDGLQRAGTYEPWRQRYLVYGNLRLEALATAPPDDAGQFRRRFGYVLHHHALHLQDGAPEGLLQLMSRAWLDGWRRLEAEDGVYGGFYEDVFRAETFAREHRLYGEHCRALMIKASVTSMSSNVAPWLMRRLVETRLWPLSRALRLIKRLVDDEERASALGILAGAVDTSEQIKILQAAQQLPAGYRGHALAWMIADLADTYRQTAFEAILADGTIFRRNSPVSLERFIERLPLRFVPRLLDAARAVTNPEQRLHVMVSIAASTGALRADDHRGVLDECERAVAGIESAETRAYFRHRIASAAIGYDADVRDRQFRSMWDEVKSLPPDGDATQNLLGVISDGIATMDEATRAEVIATMWRAIEQASFPWFALSYLGPRLGRMGFVKQVLERADAVMPHEYGRGMLLASLLPFAADDFNGILERLQLFKDRQWAIRPLAQHVRLLSVAQRAAYVDEVLGWVRLHRPCRGACAVPGPRPGPRRGRQVPRLLSQPDGAPGRPARRTGAASRSARRAPPAHGFRRSRARLRPAARSCPGERSGGDPCQCAAPPRPCGRQATRR